MWKIHRGYIVSLRIHARSCPKHFDGSSVDLVKKPVHFSVCIPTGDRQQVSIHCLDCQLTTQSLVQVMPRLFYSTKYTSSNGTAMIFSYSKAVCTFFLFHPFFWRFIRYSDSARLFAFLISHRPRKFRLPVRFFSTVPCFTSTSINDYFYRVIINIVAIIMIVTNASFSNTSNVMLFNNVISYYDLYNGTTNPVFFIVYLHHRSSLCHHLDPKAILERGGSSARIR